MAEEKGNEGIGIQLIAQQESAKAWEMLYDNIKHKMSLVAIDRLMEFKDNFRKFWEDGFICGVKYAEKERVRDGRLQRSDVPPGGGAAPSCDPERSGSGG